MFIDTHCHLSQEDYDDIDLVIQENRTQKIDKIIVSGCTMESILESIDISKKYEDVFITLGFHPSEALRVTDDDWRCTSAITRGYSDTGEGIDVTDKFNKANMASLLPKGIRKSETEVGVKVEAIIPKVAYNEVNELIDPSTNTDMRSIVSGIIRAEVVSEKLMELVMLVPLSYYFPNWGLNDDDPELKITFPKENPIVPFTFTNINPMEESVEQIVGKIKTLCDEFMEAITVEKASVTARSLAACSDLVLSFFFREEALPALP